MTSRTSSLENLLLSWRGAAERGSTLVRSGQRLEDDLAAGRSQMRWELWTDMSQDKGASSPGALAWQKWPGPGA
ncbi:hypothetical protein ACYSM9_02800 [Arthrobacter sp. C152]